MASRIFLTVGTTEFDALVRTVDSVEFLQLAKSCGCRNLVLQIGRGTYTPQYLNPEECARHGVSFEYFRFKPSLGEEMAAADLIISHGGAGSVLDAISLHKLLLVVVNDSLQDNHQVEIADAMTSRSYCLQTLPSGLLDTLQQVCSRLRDIEKVTHRDKCTSDSEDTTGGGCDDDEGSLLLQAMDLVPYPAVDAQAFPKAVDAMFCWE